jgi:hypothetical protein
MPSHQTTISYTVSKNTLKLFDKLAKYARFWQSSHDEILFADFNINMSKQVLARARLTH